MTVPNYPQTLPANTVVGRLGTGPGPTEGVPFSLLTSNLLSSITAPNTMVIAQGPGTFAPTDNYGPLNDLSGTYHIITAGSIAAPTTNPDAVLIVQKNSAVTGLGASGGPPNPNPAAYFSLTKNTGGTDRGVAVFGEAKDLHGSNQGFIEGCRFHAILTGGASGEAFGGVLAASAVGVTYNNLVAVESAVYNGSGVNAPATFNGTDPFSSGGNLAVGFLADANGPNMSDVGFLVNMYSDTKFRRGFVIGNNSVDQVGFVNYASSIVSFQAVGTNATGIDLASGTQTFAAIAIGNNTPIRMRNQAGNSDFNVMILDAGNVLDIGSDPKATNVPRISHATTALTLGATNNDIVITQARNRISGPGAPFTVSGFNYTPGVTDGQRVYLHNATAQQMTIVNAAASAAANQILTLTGANVVLRAGPSFATFSYDTVVSKYILESFN